MKEVQIAAGLWVCTLQMW